MIFSLIGLRGFWSRLQSGISLTRAALVLIFTTTFLLCSTRSPLNCTVEEVQYLVLRKYYSVSCAKTAVMFWQCYVSTSFTTHSSLRTTSDLFIRLCSLKDSLLRCGTLMLSRHLDYFTIFFLLPILSTLWDRYQLYWYLKVRSNLRVSAQIGRKFVSRNWRTLKSIKSYFCLTPFVPKLSQSALIVSVFRRARDPSREANSMHVRERWMI